MDTYRIMIVGGGTCAGYAAKALVGEGAVSGDVVILSAESVLPCNRPSLSKGILQGEKPPEKALISKMDFYKKEGIDIRLETPVARIRTDEQLVETEQGERIGYERLLIATGTQPRRFPLNISHNAEVHYLRTLPDAKRIIERAEHAEDAVVIGAGFIGMEVAASLSKRGKSVHLVFPEAHLMPFLMTKEMAAFFETYFSERNVTIVSEQKVVELKPKKEKTEVVFADAKTLTADLVVAGLGVTPVEDICGGTPIETGNGVRVNERLETSVPGIFAAGDVANYPDLVFEKRRRVEHWQTACDQGELAAKNLLGGREEYKNIPYFFSDVFDLSWEFWGDVADADEVVYLGDVNTKSFSAWWLRRGTVTAAFVMGREDDERDAAMNAVQNLSRMPEKLIEGKASHRVTLKG
jgi:3-phenylpropionate/trans-cinnamate dioxygenase ferredoxin reductase component